MVDARSGASPWQKIHNYRAHNSFRKNLASNIRLYRLDFYGFWHIFHEYEIERVETSRNVIKEADERKES